MSKFAKSFVYFFLGTLIVIFFGALQNSLINLGFSWVWVYLIPWLSILAFSLLSARMLFQSLTRHFRIWIPILLFFVLPSLFFLLNPVYEGDFNKSGKSVEIFENQILADVLSHNSDFSGVVCVASPSCPYCIEAVKTKINPVFKRGKINAAVYLANGNLNTINQFRMNSNAPEIPIVVNSKPELGIDIDETLIPVFLFIENKKIVHVWRNEQLGFPALDWIESGIK